MKKITSISLLLLLVALTTTSCTQKTSGTKTVYTTVTNPSTGGGTGGTGGTGGGGTTNPTGCSDGVPRNGSTECYYTNIPRVVVSGPGKYGTTIWSSRNLDSSISQNQFRTDATLAIRLKPTYPNALETSIQGRTCAGHTAANFSKLKVSIMVRKANSSLGYTQDLIADVNSFSNTARYRVPVGTSDPFIVEVIGVSSNHRCLTQYYGNLTTQEKAACNSGTLWYDIPVNAGSATECVAFKMDMATDDTYDLPN